MENKDSQCKLTNVTKTTVLNKEDDIICQCSKITKSIRLKIYVLIFLDTVVVFKSIIQNIQVVKLSRTTSRDSAFRFLHYGRIQLTRMTSFPIKCHRKMYLK